MKKIISNGTTFIVGSAFFIFKCYYSSVCIFFKSMAVLMAIKLVKFLKIMTEILEKLL